MALILFALFKKNIIHPKSFFTRNILNEQEHEQYQNKRKQD
jgi:hypothetical protein